LNQWPPGFQPGALPLSYYNTGYQQNCSEPYD